MERSFRKYCNILLFNPYASLAVAIASVVIVLHGNTMYAYGVSLVGVMLFWVYGMTYGFLNLYEMYCYAIMQFLLFVFLLSRPVIAEIYNVEWTYWSDDTISKSMIVLLVCEISMFCGARLVRQPDRAPAADIRGDKQIQSAIQNALLILLGITGLVCAFSEVTHFLEYRYMSYEAIYTDSQSYEPAAIRILSTLFPYSVFAYLACMPEKRKALLVMGAYVAMGIPSFLLGNRTSLVLKIAFVTIYFFIRDYARKDDEPAWITNTIKVGFSVFVLFAIAFLGAYNYIRAGKSASEQTYMPIIADFFFRQGTTYDTLCQGFQYEAAIKSFPETLIYSLGPFIDNIQNNALGRLLFGTTGLGSGNSVSMVMNSNNLAHRLSYVALGETSYLQGHGRGSSFLIETFYDGGYFGVALFSSALGYLMASINSLIQKRSWVINMILLFVLSSVLMCPRSSASECICFLVAPHFWLMMAYIIMAVMFSRSELADKLIVWKEKKQT